ADRPDPARSPDPGGRGAWVAAGPRRRASFRVVQAAGDRFAILPLRLRLCGRRPPLAGGLRRRRLGGRLWRALSRLSGLSNRALTDGPDSPLLRTSPPAFGDRPALRQRWDRVGRPDRDALKFGGAPLRGGAGPQQRQARRPEG